MKNILPWDIQRLIFKKAILYIVKIVLWEIGMILVNVLTWRQLTGMSGIHILFWIITLALPFLFVKAPKEFLHSSVEGEVKDIHIKEETGTYKAGIRYFPYVKHVIMLDVITEEGKTVRVKAREYGVRSNEGYAVPFEGDVQRHLHDYAVGDRVYRFRGLSFPLIVTQNQKSNTGCLVCGSESPNEESVCYYCGHTLLKFDGEFE